MTPTEDRLVVDALNEVRLAIEEGIEKLPEFTTSDAYVALDIGRCTLEGVLAGANPVEEGYEVVRRWRHKASRWSAARG
jgi:hypothetical protein